MAKSVLQYPWTSFEKHKKHIIMLADKFQISVNLIGRERILKVEVRPTTDDADTYVCIEHNKDITQIRKDSGQWKQLWGNLNNDEVAVVGNEIDKVLLK